MYAQVNRDRKNKNGGPGRANNHVQDHQTHPTHQQMLQQQQHHQQQLASAGYNPLSDYSDHADHWQVMQTHQTVAGNGTANIVDGNGPTATGQGGQAGDSWV